MKPLLFLTTCLLLLFVHAFGQPVVRASLGPGSRGNTVKIYLRSEATQTPTNISTLQFNLAISNAIAPRPTAVAVSSPAFSGITWAVSGGEEGGYYHFNIATGSSPIAFNIAAYNGVDNTNDLEVMEVTFSGGPMPPTATVSLVTLPDGGAVAGPNNGYALFLCTGTLQSDGSSLYFARAGGVSVNNQFSYDITGAVAGTTTSFASLGGISLPTRFVSFLAVKKGNDAQLSWTVENEEQNIQFDIERSTDGQRFTKIKEVPALQNGHSANSYSVTDAGIHTLRSKNIYYRVKQVENTGNIIYSAIRNVQPDSKDFSLGLYPNPAFATTRVVFDAPQAGKGSIILYDVQGKQVQVMNKVWTKGFNQQILQVGTLVAGEYTVLVTGEGMSQGVKLRKVK